YLSRSAFRYEGPVLGPVIGRFDDLSALTALNEKAKTYSVLDVRAALRAADRGGPRPAFTLQRLGQDTVAGFPCQMVRLSSSRGSENLVCVAEGIHVSNDWEVARNPSIDVRDKNGFPGILESSGVTGLIVRSRFRRKDSSRRDTMELESF